MVSLVLFKSSKRLVGIKLVQYLHWGLRPRFTIQNAIETASTHPSYASSSNDSSLCSICMKLPVTSVTLAPKSHTDDGGTLFTSLPTMLSVASRKHGLPGGSEIPQPGNETLNACWSRWMGRLGGVEYQLSSPKKGRQRGAFRIRAQNSCSTCSRRHEDIVRFTRRVTLSMELDICGASTTIPGVPIIYHTRRVING